MPFFSGLTRLEITIRKKNRENLNITKYRFWFCVALEAGWFGTKLQHWRIQLDGTEILQIKIFWRLIWRLIKFI